MENQTQSHYRSYISGCQRKDLSYRLSRFVEKRRVRTVTSSFICFVFKKISEEILDSPSILVESLDSFRYEFVIDVASFALPRNLHRSFLAKVSYELLQLGMPDYVRCFFTFEEGYPIYLNVSFLINYGSLN